MKLRYYGRGERGKRGRGVKATMKRRRGEEGKRGIK
jgi:hypothetical protein